MEYTCRKRDFACPNYIEANPDVSIATSENGNILEGVYNDNYILIVQKGSFSISYDQFLDRRVEEGQMVMIPKVCYYKIDVSEDVRVVKVKLKNKIEFCERFSIEWLFDHKESEDIVFHILEIRPDIKELAENMERHITTGIRCSFFMDLKVTELMFLLKTHYSRNELAQFFYPLISRDSDFSNFIHENYTKYKTVQEFAAASCHSLSSFNKIFLKTFGMSPYKWMQEQKAKRIYHEINTSNKSLKEISDSFGFSSLSQFSNFCKSKFGYSPRKLKEVGKTTIISEKKES